MPILVQWKWQKETRSFLVIFHFYDDYSKRNLRFKKRKFIGKKGGYLYFPNKVKIPDLTEVKTFRQNKFEFEKPVMTWATSHVELGYFGEILRYANIIDGLDYSKKEELRDKLEVVYAENGHLHMSGADCLLQTELKNKTWLIGSEARDSRPLFCVELCAEYIDYLKKILKPYIS